MCSSISYSFLSHSYVIVMSYLPSTYYFALYGRS
eukprot:UN21984